MKKANNWPTSDVDKILHGYNMSKGRKIERLKHRIPCILSIALFCLVPNRQRGNLSSYLKVVANAKYGHAHSGEFENALKCHDVQ